MLVRTPNWLGDCVMALESVAGVIDQGRGTTLWCHCRVRGLYEFFFPGTPLLTLGVPVPAGRFSNLLLLTNSFRSGLLGFMSGVPERIGYRRGAGSLLLTRSLPGSECRDRHHSLGYENLVNAAGFRPVPVDVPPGSPDGHLAVFPGAMYGEAKRWPAFPEVVLMLGMRAVFYGAEREREALEHQAGRCGARVMAGLSIPDLARRLLRAGACLGNDSGGVHLAAALGIPTVAVFCSTNPSWTGPRGKRVRTVAAGAECSPCYRRSCPTGTYACTHDVTPEQVAEAVRHV